MKRAILLVFSNPISDSRTDEFNTWYTDVHLPEFLRIPGIVAARRFVLSDEQMRLPPEIPVGGRRYLAAYEIETRDLASLRHAIASSAHERTHAGLLERDPLPLALLFEQSGERQVAEEVE